MSLLSVTAFYPSRILLVQFFQFQVVKQISRKGLPCALAMVDGLLEGIPLEEADRVFFVDIVPNTPAGKRLQLLYLGEVRFDN